MGLLSSHIRVRGASGAEVQTSGRKRAAGLSCRNNADGRGATDTIDEFDR